MSISNNDLNVPKDSAKQYIYNLWQRRPLGWVLLEGRSKHWRNGIKRSPERKWNTRMLLGPDLEGVDLLSLFWFFSFKNMFFHDRQKNFFKTVVCRMHAPGTWEFGGSEGRRH